MLNTIKVSAVYDRKHVATKATAKSPIKGLIQLSLKASSAVKNSGIYYLRSRTTGKMQAVRVVR